MKCPEVSELLEWMEGNMAGGAIKRLEDHLKTGCALCNERKDWVARITTLMREDTLSDAPEDVIRKGFEASQRIKAMSQWLHARLEFDSASAPRQQGVRSTGSVGRQWIFKTPLHTIVLSLQPAKTTASLSGQVIGIGKKPAASICLVELAGDKKLMSTRTGPTGDFVFGLVPQRFDLKIHTEQEAILIPDLR